MLGRLSLSSARFSASAASNRSVHTVTLIPGDGIGPEISDSVVKIFKAAGCPIEWEVMPLSTKHVKPGEPLLPESLIASVKKNKVGLKGPLATPIGKGHPSLNLTVRKAFGLYANVRPCVSSPAFETKYKNVNCIVIRENTEGEYCGIENEIVPGVMQSLKVITHKASLKVASYAFQLALHQQRKRVTAVHKANIMRMSDGLFLQACREVSTRYPTIEYEEMKLDNVCLKLITNPSSMDVMVLPNLYGDIVSDLGAGLIGGLGLTPSGNIGDGTAVFEAVHGTAPDIAGQNKANPTALLMSACMMLRHLKLLSHADSIENAISQALSKPENRTGDLGGTATTDKYTAAIIKEL